MRQNIRQGTEEVRNSEFGIRNYSAFRIPHSELRHRSCARRGVTLIELLMTIVIGSIAMLGMWPPFVAERVFWNKGKRQTEAQRDAQMGLRAIARVAREGNGWDSLTLVNTPSFSRIDITTGTSCGIWRIEGGPALPGGPGQLQMLNEACPPNPRTLIDGVRSRVTNFRITTIVPNRLMRVHLEVSHRLRTSDPRTEQEILETEIYLRNGT